MDLIQGHKRVNFHECWCSLQINSLVTCPALASHCRAADQAESVTLAQCADRKRVAHFLCKGTPSPPSIQNDMGKSSFSSLSGGNEWCVGIVTVTARNTWAHLVQWNFPRWPGGHLCSSLGGSGKYDQCWKPEVKWRKRSIAALSTENYKVLHAYAVNYIFILLAWDRRIFLHTKVPG